MARRSENRYHVTTEVLVGKVLPFFPELTQERLELLYQLTTEALLDALLQYGRINFGHSFTLTMTRAVSRSHFSGLYNKHLKGLRARYRISFRTKGDWLPRIAQFEKDYVDGKVKSVEHLNASIYSKEAHALALRTREHRGATLVRQIAASLRANRDFGKK